MLTVNRNSAMFTIKNIFIYDSPAYQLINI